MNPVRAAVVGAGYLGTFHAEKYARAAGCELVAIADVDEGRARALADRLGCRAVADYRELVGAIDCASVVVPTIHHRAVGEALLGAGIDCLVEKPLAASAADAAELVRVANARGRILQVGHLERFNPALTRLARMIDRPRFIECHRLASFTTRGADVDVVRDLMIHDLDLIRLLVPGDVVSIEAVGVPVVTPQVDIANARLRFAGGCIANVTASRVSVKRERKLRLFQRDAYLAIDLGERSVRICRRTMDDRGQPEIGWEQIDLGEADALAKEIEAFLASVRTRARPAVTGEDGLAALELAERILAVMETE
ncbi:MAG TPA: Gfo/Idh/MocA family oxidoreductase [Candidatus Binatia bacterium]|nr:Gfo/Idh/MocA family oxidoreductase [Candidatus Binatia bacterium]